MIDFNFNIKENSPVYCINCNKLLVNLNNTYLGIFSIFRCFNCEICFCRNSFIAYDGYKKTFRIDYYKDRIFITNKTTGVVSSIENLFDLDSIKEVIEFIKKISNDPELFIFT